MSNGNGSQARVVSESDFFRQVGLDSSNNEHQRLFDIMRAEALQGSRRLSQGGHLNGAVNEEVFRAEVLRIYETATPETKQVYDRGATTGEGGTQDNWVVRWLLWQAINQPNGR